MTEIIQGTPEWFAIRCGKATASKVTDVIAKTKTGPAASRANYLAQLVAERLTGKPAESFSNGAMQWGTDQEPYARAAYELKTDALVDQVGFVDHPTVAMSGASPDGLIDADGLVEIKCPNTATHIEYLLGKQVPPKYKPQMAWQLACTGRQWCDFVSFDPRMPERFQLFVIRYVPEAGYIAELEKEVSAFLETVAKTIEQLESLMPAENTIEQAAEQQRQKDAAEAKAKADAAQKKADDEAIALISSLGNEQQTDQDTVSKNGASSPPEFPAVLWSLVYDEIDCALTGMNLDELKQVAHFIDRLTSLRKAA